MVEDPGDTEKTFSFGLDRRKMCVRELKGTISLGKAIDYIIGELETPPEVGDILNVNVLYQGQSGKTIKLTHPAQVYEVTQLEPLTYQIKQGDPHCENKKLYEFIAGASLKQSRDLTFLVEVDSKPPEEESLEIEVEKEFGGKIDDFHVSEKTEGEKIPRPTYHLSPGTDEEVEDFMADTGTFEALKQEEEKPRIKGKTARFDSTKPDQQNP